MEENKVEVIETKKTKREAIKEWCKEHPDVVFTVFGGVCSLLGGVLKLIATKSEFDDNLYTTVDDEVYKIPSKKMRTAKNVTNRKKDL